MLRKILRFIQLLDYLLTRFVYSVFPLRYRRHGHCRKTGVCCHSIGIVAPAWILESRAALRLVIAWYEYVDEFFIKGVYPAEQVLVFGCPYLKENICSRYASRPPLCRSYPQGGFFTKPATFPTCGFSFKETQSSR